MMGSGRGKQGVKRIKYTYNTVKLIIVGKIIMVAADDVNPV